MKIVRNPRPKGHGFLGSIWNYSTSNTLKRVALRADIVNNVAIIHDQLLFFGGAERVLIAFLKMYPQSDLYTAFISEKNRKIIHKYISGKIITSPFQNILLSPQLADYFKPFLYYWWKTINLNKYDLIISSSHSFSSKSVNPPQNIPHISYIHTPPRYLWGEFNETKWIHNKTINYFLSPIFKLLRKIDYKDAQRPNLLIANSKTVQGRIKKYYHRDSTVIYPPVIIPKQIIFKKPKYFLCVSQLVKQKGVDLAIKACNKLRIPLLIVGAGKEESYLKSIAGPTIKFLGQVSDKKLNSLYSKSIALLYPSYQEDFGLAPVEAMAHGVPVIACRDGGVSESVIDGKTGILIKNHSVNSLILAIKKLSKMKFKKIDCIKRANIFSEKLFRKKIKSPVAKILNKKTNIQKKEILGVKVSITNYNQLINFISKNIQKKKKTYIFPAAVAAIMSYKEDKNLLRKINKQAIVVTDGMPLVWLCKYLGYKSASRVYGPTLMEKLLAEGINKKFKFYLFGGKKGQSKKLKNILCQNYENLSIVGSSDADNRPVEEVLTKKVIEEINQKRADIVFVALGNPHQEKWILDNASKINAPILIGVGAAFDFLSGDKKQAPRWMQEIGLEWFYRLMQEPRRLWYRYTITNLKFFIAAGKEITFK